MKAKHKLSNEIMREIGEIARALPPMVKVDKHGNPIYVKTRVDGAKLDRSHTKDGHKPIAGMIYAVNQCIEINHNAELTEAFRSGGWERVHAYSQAVQQQKKLAKERARQKNSWVAQFGKAIKEFFNPKAA